MNLDELRKPLFDLYQLLNQELSQDWKSYEITINDNTYDINQECEPAVRSMVIKQLLKDAINAHIDSIDNDDFEGVPFAVISRIFSGARKEDHQFEIIKENVVSNLDENGNPITAKPLNLDSLYIQWQDQNRFPSFDEYLKTRFTDEEIAQIEKEAQTEVLELKEGNV